MQSLLTIERWDADTRWNLTTWLNTPWCPPFDDSETNELFTILTFFPFIASIVVFFYSCAIMLNQGHFDHDHSIGAIVGLVFALGWVVVKLSLISNTHYEPVHYITETKIKALTMDLVRGNQNYLSVGQNIKEKLDGCDERWAQHLLRQLQNAVEQRDKMVAASLGAEDFEEI